MTTTVMSKSVSIYVDRTAQQWVVRDPGGEFWGLPTIDGGWENRQPYTPSEEQSLEPVPGHYGYLLRLPF